MRKILNQIFLENTILYPEYLGANLYGPQKLDNMRLNASYPIFVVHIDMCFWSG